MDGPTRYRLRECRTDPAGYEILDPESGRVVGVALPEPVEAAKGKSTGTVRAGSILDRLLRIVEPVLFLFWLAAAIFGKGPFCPPPSSRPRLIVRRPEDGAVVLTLRVSSGLLYDSRMVYDGQGGLVAQFRSFKSSVGGGFHIVDLRNTKDGDGSILERPWLGDLRPEGSAYHLRLVAHPIAGRITPHTARPEDDPPGTMVRGGVDHHEVDASAALQREPRGEILLLAAALAVAWWPPPG